MILFVNVARTEKVELDERGAWYAARGDTSEMWGPPRLLEAEQGEEHRLLGEVLSPKGRNRFVLSVDVELTRPLDAGAARAAASLVADDIGGFLAGQEWGFGMARVEAVYAPSRQFAHGDFFAPGEEVSE